MLWKKKQQRTIPLQRNRNTKGRKRGLSCNPRDMRGEEEPEVPFRSLTIETPPRHEALSIVSRNQLKLNLSICHET